ncbi:Protein C-ets-1, variant 2 [Dermatophagoides farinae]|uniref:Protein C-ets-1, variant 2 n=1 Tax=Dermatophagoides farinae TaxID=6954 RepID=A0A922HU23_DERFA|nr:Protein C-ets-1, variant 2 [Dermatophagoides farinae]
MIMNVPMTSSMPDVISSSSLSTTPMAITTLSNFIDEFYLAHTMVIDSGKFSQQYQPKSIEVHIILWSNIRVMSYQYD